MVIALLSTIFSVIFIYTDELFLLKREIWVYIFFYVLFSMISYHTFNFLRWRERAKEASFVTLFSYISGMLTGLLFLYFHKSVEAYLQGLIVGVFFGAIVSLYISREYILNFKIVEDAKERLKELLKLSLPFIPSYLGDTLMQMADRVVILMLFGKYELGLYAIIIKLAMIPQIVLGTVTGGFLPVMLKNYNTPKGKSLIRNFFHIYLLIIPISFLVVYPISEWAVELFGGKDFVEASYLLPMAIASILFVQSNQASGFGYYIKRKTHYIIYITFGTVALNYIFSLILGYEIGIEGVILGTLIAGIIKTYINTLYSERLYSVEYSFKLLTLIGLFSLILSILTSKGAL